MNKKEYSFQVTGLELLTIAFVVLKLTGNIDWSWWWVASPTLIPVGITVTILIIYFLMKRRQS